MKNRTERDPGPFIVFAGVVLIALCLVYGRWRWDYCSKIKLIDMTGTDYMICKPHR